MMEFKLQVVVSDDGHPPKTLDLTKLIKPSTSIENLGLNLAESKNVLKSLQEIIIKEQTNAYLDNHQCCPDCRRGGSQWLDKKAAKISYSHG